MENRAHLLDCALALFSARGFDAVGVQEIVEAAGVTKPTLYHYFTNKRGLLDTLLDERFKPLTTALCQAAEYQGDLVMSLRKVMLVFFNFAVENPVFYRLQLALYFASPESEPNQAASHFSLEQYRLVEEMFVHAGEQHGNLKGRHGTYAATFIGLINTFIGLFLNGHIVLSEPLVYQAVQQFMYGIFS
jgi:TetR/AcrR family transcriptional regulator